MEQSSHYEKDGKKYLRVTSLLAHFPDPELQKWELRIGSAEAARIKKAATDTGSNVDAWCRAQIMERELPKLLNDDAKRCADQFLVWRERYGYRLTEGKRLYSDELLVCGEPDILADDDMVIDIKAAKMISSKYRIQVGCYCLLTGRRAGGILRLDKGSTQYEFDHSEDYGEHIKEFFRRYESYHYDMKWGKTWQKN